MSGYQAEVRDKILNTNAHLILQRDGAVVTSLIGARLATKTQKKVPGVVATSPFIFTGGMLVGRFDR